MYNIFIIPAALVARRKAIASERYNLTIMNIKHYLKYRYIKQNCVKRALGLELYSSIKVDGRNTRAPGFG